MTDIRDAWRSLRATPIVSVVVVLSLALAIGANTAIFSLINAITLRPLPVREPGSLFSIEARYAGPYGTFAIWQELRDRQLFAEGFIWAQARFDVAPEGPPQLVDGMRASADLYDVIGLRAFRGRLFTASDFPSGGGAAERIAVISHRFWQRRFGGTDDVVGKTVTVDRVPHTIVGVTPPAFLGFTVGFPTDVTTLLVPSPTSRVSMMVRLKPGQTAGSANALLASIVPQVRAATTPLDASPIARELAARETWSIIPASERATFLKSRYERPLRALMGVVVLVLLIACANVATLLSARVVSREPELAVRVALGASRRRLARQLLTEGALLSAPGVAGGILFASWIGPLLVRQLSTDVFTVVLDLSPDWRVLGFTAAAGTLATALFASAPSLRASQAEPLEAMRQSRTTTASKGRFGFGSAMIVVQVALAVVLAIATGLFAHSFSILANKDVGFDRDRLLVASVGVGNIPEREREAMAHRIMEAVAAVPGVSGIGASLDVPGGNSAWTPRLALQDGTLLPSGASENPVWSHDVTPGWLSAMGTSLVAGRDFSPRDDASAPRVVIVNETFARIFFAGQNPVGQTMWNLTFTDSPERQLLEIVGVVESAMYRYIKELPPPTVYFPIAQGSQIDERPAFYLAARASLTSPAALVPGIIDAIARIDKDLPLTFRTLSDQVKAQYTQERLLALVSVFFGAVALFLAALGLFGVTTFGVNLRRKEIGIRIALGADTASILGIVLGRVAMLVGAGVSIGLLVSLWAAPLLRSLLFDLGPRDPATLLAAICVLLLTSALAAVQPAVRARRIDPAELLRDN